MKDLDKDCIYDLSDLNDVELNKVLTWLIKNDKGWNAYICRYLKGKSIKFDRQSEQWSFYNGYENLTNAKTLFDPKVNIINPTESDIYNGEPKYKFQHVEVNKIDNSIDLIFFKKHIDGSVSVKRVVYLCHADDEIPEEYLNDVKLSVIKFLEKCEK